MRMADALQGVRVAKFKDAEHLVRLAVVFAVVLLVFVLIRAHFIPKSFGEYGHYRGDALAELASKPMHYAGHQACEDCHSDEADHEESGQARGRQLRSLPRPARQARRGSGFGGAAAA